MKASRNMIVYLLDQYQRRNPLRKIVALLDMTGVGLSNVVCVIYIPSLVSTQPACHK